MCDVNFGGADDALYVYVAAHAGADTLALMLKNEPKLPFDKRFAVMQVECRNKAKAKIPELLVNRRFLFPKPVSAEQCTHQLVAKFHASLFDATNRVLDMTMGLGVDSYYIAQRVASLKAIELDPVIAAAGVHNYDFEVLNADSVEWLAASNERFDAIFIDPARRGEGGARLYGLADCVPNVLKLLPMLKSHTHRLYVKASPMIDVTQTLRDLNPYLTHLWAVSVRNECKELLAILDFATEAQGVKLHALNFDTAGTQAFTVEAVERLPESHFGGVLGEGQYLYEPNASVMKIGAYSAVASQFPVKQVAKNSHLYYGDSYIAEFPGRKFRIDGVVPFSGKAIKAIGKQSRRLNVATRNFRLSAEELKKRLKVRDGGDCYMFATTLTDASAVLIFTHKAEPEGGDTAL